MKRATKKVGTGANATKVNAKVMIGVDFGGTNIKAALVQDGTILRSVTVATPAEAGPTRVIDTIADAVRQLETALESVGLAIPGEVDKEGKVWRLPNVLGFEGVPIARELSLRLGCPVAVENDATTAALGEHKYGHGQKLASFLMVTLGTGIGGGLVMQNKLCRGANGFCGEIGHMRVDTTPEAWLCGCGQRGCVESYAGTRGLLRRFRELGGEARLVRDVADSARRGEAAGVRTLEQMSHALGLLLANIQNLLDLEAFVFTGGVSGSFDLIEPSLRATLRRHAFAPPLGEVPLLVSELGHRAGLVGAACLPHIHTVPQVKA